MPYFRKIVGERLYLSPVSGEEAEKYTHWMNNLETTVKLTTAPQIISLEKEKQMLELFQKEGYNFAVVQKENDELTGNCGLMNVDLVQRTAELGLFIGEKKHRGKGYGSETVQLLLDYAFNLLNLHSVYLRVRSFNEAALRCYPKLGFKEIGRRRECVLVGGSYYDEIYMDILDREFVGNISVEGMN